MQIGKIHTHPRRETHYRVGAGGEISSSKEKAFGELAVAVRRDPSIIDRQITDLVAEVREQITTGKCRIVESSIIAGEVGGDGRAINPLLESDKITILRNDVITESCVSELFNLAKQKDAVLRGKGPYKSRELLEMQAHIQDQRYRYCDVAKYPRKVSQHSTTGIWLSQGQSEDVAARAIGYFTEADDVLQEMLKCFESGEIPNVDKIKETIPSVAAAAPKDELESLVATVVAASSGRPSNIAA